MFVNTLAMRNYPTDDKSFEQFLAEVKENSLKAYQNQDYQFEMFVEKLGRDRNILSRDLSRNPLFDVAFALQNIDNMTINMPNLTFTPYQFKNKISKFDLTLTAIESDRKMSLTMEYCTDLFKKETIERMTGHYVNILKEIVKSPAIKISAIDMLSKDEKEQILFNFNQTKTEYPKEKTLPQLFEEQVACNPEQIALIFGDKQLTYQELNEKVNQLARVLER